MLPDGLYRSLIVLFKVTHRICPTDKRRTFRTPCSLPSTSYDTFSKQCEGLEITRKAENMVWACERTLTHSMQLFISGEQRAASGQRESWQTCRTARFTAVPLPCCYPQRLLCEFPWERTSEIQTWHKESVFSSWQMVEHNRKGQTLHMKTRPYLKN